MKTILKKAKWFSFYLLSIVIFPLNSYAVDKRDLSAFKSALSSQGATINWIFDWGIKACLGAGLIWVIYLLANSSQKAKTAAISWVVAAIFSSIFFGWVEL